VKSYGVLITVTPLTGPSDTFYAITWEWIVATVAPSGRMDRWARGETKTEPEAHAAASLELGKLFHLLQRQRGH
jgi:hypothetical protein